MWLIDTTTLELVDFAACPSNTYAILSHTWGSASEEVNFDEFKAGQGRQKKGYQKILMCCGQARKDRLPYAWVDTCCIDKRSSTELSEAVNSMFDWYASARICYVYLADVDSSMIEVSPNDCLSTLHSRWFTRGWTLQELIAPFIVYFFSRDWVLIGDKSHLASTLQEITGVEEDVLNFNKDFRDCSVAQRMSWASKRQTTRLEDSAYCLIGLFGVTMPLLYGEGSKAFMRLQELIIQQGDDESVFAWDGIDERGSGLLAPSAINFVHCSDVMLGKHYSGRPPYAKTNHGLSIQVQMLPCDMNTYIVPLQCDRLSTGTDAQQLAMFLCRTSKDNQYRRVVFHGKSTGTLAGRDLSKAVTRTIFIPDTDRNLELEPHVGLPTITIQSNMNFWQLIRPDQERRTDAPSDSIPAPVGDLETGIPMYELSEPLVAARLSEWTAKAVTQLHFQHASHDLERGVILACGDQDTDQQTFRYHLQLGFDQDFQPVCTVSTMPFRLTPGKKASQRTLPLLNSLWCEQDMKQVHDYSYKNWFRAFYSSIQTYTSDHTPEVTWVKGSVWSSMSVRTFDNTPNLISIQGDRQKGFNICLNDWLKVEPIRDVYQCTNTSVRLRHMGRLLWVLTIHEERAHEGVWRFGACSRFTCVAKIAYVRLNWGISRLFLVPTILLWMLLGQATLLKAVSAFGDRSTFSQSISVVVVVQTPFLLFWVVHYRTQLRNLLMENRPGNVLIAALYQIHHFFSALGSLFVVSRK